MKVIKRILLGSLVLLCGVSFAKININTANVDELSLLHGIGERKAQAIIAYRKDHGKFRYVEELSQVKGLGEKTVARLKRILSSAGKTT